jgi:hypothetical protein
VPCCWLYLASRTTPQRFCEKPGHPYCPEHQREIDAMMQSNKDWDEILASLQVVCDEPEQPEGPLCAACGSRPVHTDCPVRTACVYCEECCADDPLGILGPHG